MLDVTLMPCAVCSQMPACVDSWDIICRHVTRVNGSQAFQGAAPVLRAGRMIKTCWKGIKNQDKTKAECNKKQSVSFFSMNGAATFLLVKAFFNHSMSYVPDKLNHKFNSHFAALQDTLKHFQINNFALENKKQFTRNKSVTLGATNRVLQGCSWILFCNYSICSDSWVSTKSGDIWSIIKYPQSEKRHKPLKGGLETKTNLHFKNISSIKLI